MELVLETRLCEFPKQRDPSTLWTLPSTGLSWDSNTNEGKEILETSYQTSLWELKVAAIKPINLSKVSQDTQEPDDKIAHWVTGKALWGIEVVYLHKPRCPR